LSGSSTATATAGAIVSRSVSLEGSSTAVAQIFIARYKPTIATWDGAKYVDKPVETWNGTKYVDKPVGTWTGVKYTDKPVVTWAGAKYEVE
jgi:hypothetical protein